MILTNEERLAQAVKEMSNGTFRGLSRVASPFTPQTGGFNGFHDSLTDVGPSPFIVVANDGTGDFDDPQAAINSISAGVPTVIYVKNTGVNYSTTGVTTLTGKKIVLWGESTNMRYPSSGATGPYWSLGTTNLTMSSTTVLHVKGMMIDSSASTLGMVAGATLFLDGADIGNGSTLFIGAGNTHAHDSALCVGGTFTGTVQAWRCTMRLGTLVLTTPDHIWRDSQIFGGSFSIIYSAGSTGAQCSINNCDFGDVAASAVEGFNQAEFVGNINHGEVVFGPTFTNALTAIAFTLNDLLKVDSCMWGTALTINSSQRFNLGGVWYTATLASSGGSVCGSFSGDRGLGSFPTTVVTVSGSNIVGSIMVDRGNTNGVLVSGDANVLAVTQINPGTNIVNVTGDNNKITSEVGATTADSGTGNVFL